MTWPADGLSWATLAAGLVIGARAADIDLAPVLPIRHRSAWTHGPIAPLALYWFAAAWPAWAWWLAVGIIATNTIHQLLDCFPKGWTGSALIKWAPLPWSFGAWLSFCWIAAGVIASVWVIQRMV